MNDFENFVKLELPRRAVLLSDAPLETVLVRRGPGPRLIEGVSLKDGEVVGQVNGIVKGVTISGSGNVSKIVNIPAESTDVVDSFSSDTLRSRKWIVDIDSSDDNRMTFEVLARPLVDKVDYSIYSMIGNRIPIDINFNEINSLVYFIVSNNYNHSISIQTTVIR